MSKAVEEKREAKAQKFIANAKDAFKQFIPRDKIDEIGVTACAEKDGVFEITGPVATTSPTGKMKTFSYIADVKVDEDGTCSLIKLHVRDY